MLEIKGLHDATQSWPRLSSKASFSLEFARRMEVEKETQWLQRLSDTPRLFFKCLQTDLRVCYANDRQFAAHSTELSIFNLASGLLLLRVFDGLLALLLRQLIPLIYVRPLSPREFTCPASCADRTARGLITSALQIPLLVAGGKSWSPVFLQKWRR